MREKLHLGQANKWNGNTDISNDKANDDADDDETTLAGGASRNIVAELVSADAQPSNGRAPCRIATGSGQGALLGFSWPTRVIDVSDLT